MITITHQEKTVKVEIQKNEILINSILTHPDIQLIGNNEFHVIHHHKSYAVEVIELNKSEKFGIVKVNGKRIQFTMKDQFDELLHQLGMDNLNSSKANEVKAPMPGLVLKVLVTPGTEVKKGDNLLVLEAMKMENILKSPGDGTIQSILVQSGDKVEKGQKLIQF